MNRSMAVVLALLFVALVLPLRAFAGPNAGGTLILHRNPGLIYSADDQGYCGRSGLASCEEAVATSPADPESTVVFHVIAAFLEGSAPRLKAMAFGIHYDPERLVLVAHGPCIGDPNNGALELSGPGWPATDTGTSLVFQETQTDGLVESYWFAAYTYSAGDSTEFELTAHPDTTLGGSFADDDIPSALDTITGYGRLGFGVQGTLACPIDLADGEDYPGPGGSGVDEGPGGDGSDGGPNVPDGDGGVHALGTTGVIKLVRQ